MYAINQDRNNAMALTFPPPSVPDVDKNLLPWLLTRKNAAFAVTFVVIVHPDEVVKVLNNLSGLILL